MPPLNQPPPPEWGNDPVTDFLDNWRRNQYATFENFNFEPFIAVDKFFRIIADGAINPRPLFPMQFMLRSHSAYLTATSTAMAGDVYGAYPNIRSCLEQAGYGFFIGDNNAKAECWLRRHDGTEEKNRVRREFKHTNILSCLKQHAPEIAKHYEIYYEEAIDLGAHPNERGASLGGSITEHDEEIKFNTIYLHDDPSRISIAMKSTLRTGIISLYIFQLIYPERFKILNVKENLEKLRPYLA